MPNFETHRIYNYTILGLLTVVYVYYFMQGNVTEIYTEYQLNIEECTRFLLISVVAFFAGTELFSPDLDTDSVPYKRLYFLYFPLKWYLMPHRSKSHNPIHGPVAQVTYLGIIVWVIFMIANKVGHNLNWTMSYFDLYDLAAFSTGIFISNWTHIAIDKMYKVLGWKDN